VRENARTCIFNHVYLFMLAGRSLLGDTLRAWALLDPPW